MEDVIRALERGRIEADRDLKSAIVALSGASAHEARSRRRLEEFDRALSLIKGAATQARRVEGVAVSGEMAVNGAPPPC